MVCSKKEFFSSVGVNGSMVGIIQVASMKASTARQNEHHHVVYRSLS